MTTEATTDASASNSNLIPFQKDELVNISRDGRSITTSLIVADSFEKNHRDVLRTIENLECSNEFGLRNFAPSSYFNRQNKKQPMYLITRDGFTLLAMGFTGKKAMGWKEEYIAAFNKMEKKLYDRQLSNYPPKRIYSEINRLAVELIHVKEVLKNLDEVRQKENPVSGFAAKHCDVSMESRISKEELCFVYEGYCAARGIYALHKNTFFKRLYAYGSYIRSASITISGKRMPAVKGIRLKEVSYE